MTDQISHGDPSFSPVEIVIAYIGNEKTEARQVQLELEAVSE